VLAGLVVEAVLTFFLMFVITSVVIRKHNLGGLYIGATVGLGALAGGVDEISPAALARPWQAVCG